jgi:hypothetical protein
MGCAEQDESKAAARGIPVSDDDASNGESLEEGTRQANSNLQLLIETIGGLLTASTELLARLQQILTGSQPAPGGTNGSDESGSPPTERSEG